MPTIPSSLDARYALHAVLAARAGAVTVTATDEILQRDVWIALLLEPDDERRATFRQHAEALARRAIAGAPRVYDGSMRAPQPYVVTQPAAGGDPSTLLDVLTDDDTPTAELPIIARPPITVETAPLAAVGAGRDTRPAASPAASMRRPATAATALAPSRRRVLIAGICGVLLLSVSTMAVWAGSSGDAPAVAEQMPVVVGVDVEEKATEPNADQEPTTPPTSEPETEPPMEASVDAQPSPAPPPETQRGPEAAPAPQAPANPPGQRDKDADEKRRGPPDHAKAKRNGN